MRAGRAVAWGVALAALGAAAMAQDGMAQEGPAEAPPPGFDAPQFVDGRGCAFVRTSVGDTVSYVPRLTAEREPLCGLPPTVAVATPAVPATPEVVVAVAPPARPAPPVRVAAPARAAAPPAPSAAPAPAPAPARRITLAEACRGRSGVQPALIDPRTGLSLDCGGPPAPVAGIAAGGRPVATVPAVVAVVGRLVVTPVPAATRAVPSPSTGGLPPLRSGIPASNPVGVVPQVVPPPPGFEPAWDDGRVNPLRGVPRPVSGPVLLGGTVVPSPGAGVVVAPRAAARAAVDAARRP